MTAVAAAIVGSAALSYYASSKSAKAQSEASERAAQTQAQATDEATALQREMYYKNREDLAPWLRFGERSIGDLEAEQAALKNLIYNPSTYEKSPGYNFLLDEGINAINRGAAASGKLDSGARLKDLMKFGQGLASTDYQNAINNRNLLLNRYAANAGVGQSTAGQLGQFGQQYAGNVGNLLLNQAGNQATNFYNQANTKTGLYQNISDTTNQAAGNLLMYSML